MAAKKKIFPQTLYAKWDGLDSNDAPFLSTDESLFVQAEISGEVTEIGVYQLVSTKRVKTVVEEVS